MFKYRCPKCGYTTESVSPNASGTCLHGKPAGQFNKPANLVLVSKKKAGTLSGE